MREPRAAGIDFRARGSCGRRAVQAASAAARVAARGRLHGARPSRRYLRAASAVSGRPSGGASESKGDVRARVELHRRRPVAPHAAPGAAPARGDDVNRAVGPEDRGRAAAASCAIRRVHAACADDHREGGHAVAEKVDKERRSAAAQCADRPAVAAPAPAARDQNGHLAAADGGEIRPRSQHHARGLRAQHADRRDNRLQAAGGRVRSRKTLRRRLVRLLKKHPAAVFQASKSRLLSGGNGVTHGHEQRRIELNLADVTAVAAQARGQQAHRVSAGARGHGAEWSDALHGARAARTIARP